MDVFDWLKMGSLEQTFQCWEKKNVAWGKNWKSMDHVWALVFVLWLKTGRLKLLCVLVHCLGTKSNHDSTNLVSFFLILSHNFVHIQLFLYHILMPNWWSVLTRVLTFPIFSSVFFVTGQPGHFIIFHNLHNLSSVWKPLVQFKHVSYW